jgi:large subunit ribosomal protein L4
VLENVEMKELKTKLLGQSFETLGFGKTLIIDAMPSEAFVKAARNLKGVNVLPVVGANVYDILRHRDLVITKEAVKQLEARLA